LHPTLLLAAYSSGSVPSTQSGQAGQEDRKMTGLHLSWAQKNWEQERLGAHGPTYIRVVPENLYNFPNVGSSFRLRLVQLSEPAFAFRKHKLN
jgi:hypothetical protein